MKKLKKIFFKKDKFKHVIYGLAIYIITILLLLLIKADYKEIIGLALIPVYIAGLGKELIWDLWLGKGTPENADVIATVTIPTLISILTAFILNS